MRSRKGGSILDPEVLAALIVEDIVRDLSVRTGFADVWAGLPDEIAEHITDHWYTIAKKHAENSVLALREEVRSCA